MMFTYEEDSDRLSNTMNFSVNATNFQESLDNSFGNESYETYINEDPIDPDYIRQFFAHYWHNSKEFKTVEQIRTYFPPFLILFGTVGNVLAFWVLYRSSKQSSVFYYMLLYALTNTLNLYIACGLYWISHITGTPYIANLADWLCKIWQFLFPVIRYTSTWLVVAMAFDRFVYLSIPSKAHSLCTVFTAKIISCLIVIVLVVIGIHAMWTYELMGVNCTTDPARRDFQTIIWPWFAATVHTYLPAVVIIIFSITSTINLIMLNARQYQNRNFSPVQMELTKVVLLISISFLILSLPATILNLILYLAIQIFYSSLRVHVQLQLTLAIFQDLQFILCSINFPLYFLSLPMLRKELATLVSQLVKSKSSQSASCNNNANGVEVNGKLLKKRESNKSLECTLMTQL